ncbi:hypothetical protein ACO0RG_004294 [Hanseniaspora osmophila]|uniref:IMPACT family member n=1 Tax=Hanseniaspora osmophila TaxID=56408 RepID=A0A1E5RAW9_9ASCO|nr:IMPACT family member [Hanseniaspora osmophila]
MNWNESEVLVDKKSKFQARCCALQDYNDITKLLQQMIDSDKHIQKATHKHMYAWRTGVVTTALADPTNTKVTKGKAKKKATDQPSTGVKYTNVNQGSSDCGEKSAGQILLTLLERSNVINCLVIVTRWYGGTALRPRTL